MRKLGIILLVIGSATLGYGSANAATKRYIQTAEERGLWKNPQPFQSNVRGTLNMKRLGFVLLFIAVVALILANANFVQWKSGEGDNNP